MQSSSLTKQKFLTLNNGTTMPSIGFGTFRGENLESLIKDAINTGYLHIDTASVYENEKEIGNALNDILTEGNVKREDLYITTKVWNNAKDDVEKSLKASLLDLKLTYVDLFLIHWPIGTFDPITKELKQVPLHKTWKQMEECVNKGLCKSIGVSNFNVQLLLDLLSYAEIKPVCNQIEIHPYLIQKELVNICHRFEVKVVAFSPLCRGEARQNKSKDILQEPILKELAEKYEKSIGQIILNWHLSRGYSIIPKTSTVSRLKENFECDNFEMSNEDLEKISDLNCGFRCVDPINYAAFSGISIFD